MQALFFLITQMLFFIFCSFNFFAINIFLNEDFFIQKNHDGEKY